MSCGETKNPRTLEKGEKMLKTPFVYIFVIVTLFSIGCGTDVKPNYFIGMFRDKGDIDSLSKCLVETPSVEGDIITIKADSPCLVDLSNRDTSDPNMEVTFSEILNDPEAYMDRLLIFEAVIKKTDNRGYVELYTNRKAMEFHITSHGAEIKYTDGEGEEQNVLPNDTYQLKCRIYKIEIYTTGVWRIHAEFIVTKERKLVFPPVPVQDE